MIYTEFTNIGTHTLIHTHSDMQFPHKSRVLVVYLKACLC